MDDLEKKYEGLFEGNELFTFRGLNRVNFRPHPFMIGTRHVAHAADHHGGMLGEATLKAIPCAHPGCYKMYKDHTSDHVLFLSLNRNMTNKEAGAVLMPIADLMKADKVDGLCFVETKEKFRIGEGSDEKDNDCSVDDVGDDLLCPDAGREIPEGS